MATYDDKTLKPIPPTLGPGEKEHILVPQDECLNSTNDGRFWMWMQKKQQLLKKKGNGQDIHISGWVSKETGHLRLSEEQLAVQAAFPEDQHLPVTDSHVIIYPGKGFDDWWNLKQLMDAMVHTINIFEYTHPGPFSQNTISRFSCIGCVLLTLQDISAITTGYTLINIYLFQFD